MKNPSLNRLQIDRRKYLDKTAIKRRTEVGVEPETVPRPFADLIEAFEVASLNKTNL